MRVSTFASRNSRARPHGARRGAGAIVGAHRADVAREQAIGERDERLVAAQAGRDAFRALVGGDEPRPQIRILHERPAQGAGAVHRLAGQHGPQSIQADVHRAQAPAGVVDRPAGVQHVGVGGEYVSGPGDELPSGSADPQRAAGDHGQAGGVVHVRRVGEVAVGAAQPFGAGQRVVAPDDGVTAMSRQHVPGHGEEQYGTTDGSTS